MLPSQGLLRLAVRDLTRSFESNRGARELRSGHWQARVSSSLVRGHGLGCPTVPGSMRSRDPRYAACDGAHGAGAGCAPRAGTFKARHAPLGYQYPIWGRAAWGAGYAQRTAVERGYSLFKEPGRGGDGADPLPAAGAGEPDPAVGAGVDRPQPAPAAGGAAGGGAAAHPAAPAGPAGPGRLTPSAPHRCPAPWEDAARPRAGGSPSPGPRAPIR